MINIIVQIIENKLFKYDIPLYKIINTDKYNIFFILDLIIFFT